MSVLVPDRTMAGSGVSWNAWRWKPGDTTEGWQDKRAHVALRSGGCLCWGFWRAAHVDSYIRTVRHRAILLCLLDIPHVARLGHDR